MIPRRVLAHIERQNWFAVCVELAVVVIGVFVGIQVANWNEARFASARRAQILEALVTDLSDAIGVQQRFVDEIDAGLRAWEQSYSRGERPAPYYYRVNGSDTAPDTWGMLQQMQLADLFDAVTLFDLSFYYSELAGVGRKYVRYVIFVEDEVLPYAETRTEAFYDAGDSVLRPVYRANMDRLREFRDQSEELIEWARCLVFRLESDRVFEVSCRRADYSLDGMAERRAGSAP